MSHHKPGEKKSSTAVASRSEDTMLEGWYPPEGGVLRYRLDDWFGQGPGTGEGPSVLPDGWMLGQVSGVASHPDGEVTFFHRGPRTDPIIVCDRSGRYLRSWGRGMLPMSHGLRLDPTGDLWATDTVNHQVYRFSRWGDLRLTLGQRGVPATDDRHFNMPTDIAFGASGTVYISDGYGNSRVVKFGRDGDYLGSWGRPGTGPGEFYTPHSIAVGPDGLVYVSDRENNRIQVFDPDGAFQFQWTHLGATQGITILPDGECWMITHRNNVENLARHAVAGRVMRLELPSGRILGSFESPGHMIDRSAWGDLFVASLSGNVLRWYPGWYSPDGNPISA